MPLKDFSVDFTKVESGIQKGVLFADYLQARREDREFIRRRRNALSAHQTRLSSAKTANDRINAYESLFTSPDISDADRQRTASVLQSLYDSTGRRPSVSAAAGLAALNKRTAQAPDVTQPDLTQPDLTQPDLGGQPPTLENLSTAGRLRASQTRQPATQVDQSTEPSPVDTETLLQQDLAQTPGDVLSTVPEVVKEQLPKTPVQDAVRGFGNYISELLGGRAEVQPIPDPATVLGDQAVVDVQPQPQPQPEPEVQVTPEPEPREQIAQFIARVPVSQGNENLALLTYDKALQSPLTELFPDYAKTKVAQLAQESRFDNTLVSPAGARSIAQLYPATTTEVSKLKGIVEPGEEGVQQVLADPELAIDVSIAYDEVLINQLRNFGVPITKEALLAAYLNGAKGVADSINSTGQLPNNTDTVNYIRRINTYAKL